MSEAPPRKWSRELAHAVTVAETGPFRMEDGWAYARIETEVREKWRAVAVQDDGLDAYLVVGQPDGGFSQIKLTPEIARDIAMRLVAAAERMEARNLSPPGGEGAA